MSIKISHHLPINHSKLTTRDRNFILYKIAMQRATNTERRKAIRGSVGLSEVSELHVEDIAMLRGCGNASVRRIRQVLLDEGLDFKDASQYDWTNTNQLPVKK